MVKLITQRLQVFFQNLVEFSLGNMDHLVHLALEIIEDFGNPNLLGKLDERPMTPIGMLDNPYAPLHQS